MSQLSPDLVVEALVRHPILSPEQLESLRNRLLPKYPDSKRLAAEMVRRGWLTIYQAKELFLDRGSQLIVGAYLILDKLGEGGMGVVYKARHLKLGKLVALKVIRPETLQSDNAVRRFRREVLAAAQLNHPHIVLAFDADEANGRHYMAMEFIEGVDLARLVRDNGPLSVPLACEYIRQAALGLQHAHEAGLVHRDIKPSNLILARSQRARPETVGIVKILDLGLARLDIESISTSDSLTKSGVVMGTPDYLAPEQARNARLADIRSDLYSLGCTFFFLLTGRPPFLGETIGEKLIQHMLDEPPEVQSLRPDVPPSIAAVIRTLLRKSPEDRYATPAKLAEILQRGGEPNNATAILKPPSSDTGERWHRLTEANSKARDGGSKLDFRLVLFGLALFAIGLGGIAALWPKSATRSQTKQESTEPVVVSVEANRLWQDTGVDVVAGQAVILVPAAVWRKGNEACTAAGLPNASRNRCVWPKAPYMALLARIENEPTPTAILGRQSFKPSRNGRLFLQVNDLDLAQNLGTLNVTVIGGYPSDVTVPIPEPTPVQQADSELAGLLRGVSADARRDVLIRFVTRRAGTPQAEYVGRQLLGLPPVTNSLGMQLIAVPPGQFLMGSPPDEVDRDNDELQRLVTLTTPFEIACHEVTVGQFRAFVKDSNYRTQAELMGGAQVRTADGQWRTDPEAYWDRPGFTQTDSHPVVAVSWHDAMAFCEWLSQREGNRYTLPTAAQWEYACRAGTTTPYHWGRDLSQLDAHCWHAGNSGHRPHPVGTKKPNPWGLFDMAGNVYEWTTDGYEEHPSPAPQTDPVGSLTNPLKVMRGGSWGGNPKILRSAYCEGQHSPDERLTSVGFRVVRLPGQPVKTR